MDRRRFVHIGAAVAGALLLTPALARAATRVTTRVATRVATRTARRDRGDGRYGDEHPKPRPGITAVNVTSREQLERTPNVADAFESVRAIPQVIDGLRCHCGCAGLTGYYSLLSCFEGPNAMALACPICPGEARMAARLHKGGSTLDEIRAALDAKFG